MTDIKQISLTGIAADSYVNKGSRRRSRKNQAAGGSTQGAIVQLQSTTSSSETSSSTAAVQGVNPSEVVKTAASVTAPTTITTQSGGKTKVVLKAPTKKASKVVLAVSKVPVIKAAKLETTSNKKTRKSSKKILFSLKNLRKKLSTAKTIKKHSEEKPLEEIKKILVQAKLIKEGSKAPESMIRQIYNDYMSLKHKAL
uniref:Uncharacterized protein n=1 Tax=viral metagenome TaxID=1070528 RepID=A0A6C0D7U8_9ZZZZ